jgi:hypothetical protein
MQPEHQRNWMDEGKEKEEKKGNDGELKKKCAFPPLYIHWGKKKRGRRTTKQTNGIGVGM